jgi:Yip1 domain
MKNMQLAFAWVTDPKAAAKAIEQKPTFWFPLIVLTLVTAGTAYIFFSWVDMAWFADATLRANPRQMTEEQIAQAAQFMSGGTIKWIGVIGSLFVVPIISLLYALYYLIAGRITGVSRSYKQWFSLTCWTSLPQVLATLPGLFVLMTTTNRQVGQSVMSPFSLNELFFHRTMDQPGYSFLTSMNLVLFVSLFLAVLALRLWSGRSWLFCSVFTLLPTLLIFGIWGFVSLR